MYVSIFCRLFCDNSLSVLVAKVIFKGPPLSTPPPPGDLADQLAGIQPPAGPCPNPDGREEDPGWSKHQPFWSPDAEFPRFGFVEKGPDHSHSQGQIMSAEVGHLPEG